MYGRRAGSWAAGQLGSQAARLQYGAGGTPNLPTNIAHYSHCFSQLSGKSPTGLGIPPLTINIVLESNPLKSTPLLVGRLAVPHAHPWSDCKLVALAEARGEGICQCSSAASTGSLADHSV